MTPKQLSKKISELCLHRETLQAERADLVAEFAAAKALPKVSESVKQTAKIKSQVDAIDAELTIIDSMIEDESSGLDAAIEQLQAQVRDNERDHAKAMRQALSDFLQSDKVAEAKRVIASVESLVAQINPMMDFQQHDACRYLLNNSRESGVVALSELVKLPEEQPAPPELELLVDAQRAISDASSHTIVTAGSEPRVGRRISCQPTNEARQKVIGEIAAQRDKASAA